ncbi:cytochrome P450 [Annulohypoxylon truncatum]|uniref:cytochrome P450 n=1 Tax=Annulohypoxylon truncatum TaxID=327061 RepID=UPI002008B0E1|nr:cytochrome P450 [Annulohypoxylon truncatum]KAI1204770.1 cytochrome P450 [Annulohypoxylon truncatum]
MSLHDTFVLLGVVVGTYGILRVLIWLTHNPKEPPVLVEGIPFISPAIGMMVEKQNMQEYRHSVYTLRLPGKRLYVINSLSLYQIVQHNTDIISWDPVKAHIADKIMGRRVSTIGLSVVQDFGCPAEGGTVWGLRKTIYPLIFPGRPALDELNRTAFHIMAAGVEDLAAKGCTTIALYAWLSHQIFVASLGAVYGRNNPLIKPENESAWGVFEKGIFLLMADVLPQISARKAIRARETLVKELEEYLRRGGQQEASSFAQATLNHFAQHGLDYSDLARGELGNIAGIVTSTMRSVFWLFYHVASDPRLLGLCRSEVAQLARNDSKPEEIDLAHVSTNCPVLLAAWQEVQRIHADPVFSRVVMQDFLLDGRYLLKKGSSVLIPAGVIHQDSGIWGSTSLDFDHERFLVDGRMKQYSGAVQTFGAGAGMCPGRHFVSVEILQLVAMLIMRLDIQPVGGGKWTMPSKQLMLNVAFPTPSPDVEVEVLPRTGPVWQFTFTKNQSARDAKI